MSLTTSCSHVGCGPPYQSRNALVSAVPGGARTGGRSSMQASGPRCWPIDWTGSSHNGGRSQRRVTFVLDADQVLGAVNADYQPPSRDASELAEHSAAVL